MLQAKTKDGKLITPAKLNRHQLARKRSKTFFCPVCDGRVILKAGPHVIPHFAHQSAKICPSSRGGEGPYHEQGKLILYEWLIKQNLDVQLEAYIPEINQQPDILMTINQRKIAIEYQCSRIPIEYIQQRNNGYLRVNIQPIWILSARLFKQRTTNMIHVDRFTQQFIQQFSSTNPLTIFYFCPLDEKFLLAQHIHLLTSSSAYAQLYYNPLNRLNFLDLFTKHPLNVGAFKRHWQFVKRDFRVRPRVKRYGRSAKWYHWLYDQQTHVQYLPSIIYLPIQAQIYMKSPLWEWQSRLCLDIIRPARMGSAISLSFVQNYFKHATISPRSFPLIKQLPHPVYEYFKLLQSLNYFQRQNEDTFIKIRELKFHKHVEKAVETDYELIGHLLDVNYLNV